MSSDYYNLKYLPLFEQDLREALQYISVDLQNKPAAEKLLTDVENAVKKGRDQSRRISQISEI